MEKIEPTTTVKEDEAYKLEDKDYLMIKAIQDLTEAINQLKARLSR